MKQIKDFAVSSQEAGFDEFLRVLSIHIGLSTTKNQLKGCYKYYGFENNKAACYDEAWWTTNIITPSAAIALLTGKQLTEKDLIVDQLIEEYQKELKIAESENKTAKYSIDFCKSKVIADRIQNIESKITRLHSLRQQEVQNVIDAHFAGIRRLTNDPAKASTDYFTQTFEQKGGGNG